MQCMKILCFSDFLSHKWYILVEKENQVLRPKVHIEPTLFFFYVLQYYCNSYTLLKKGKAYMKNWSKFFSHTTEVNK